MHILPFISDDASWLGLIFDLTAFITLVVTIYQMKEFWLSFNTQNLSIDARKGLDSVDELEDNFNALMIVVKDPHQKEEEYPILTSMFLSPLNNLQNVLHILSVRVTVDFTPYLAWVKDLRKTLLQKQLEGSKSEALLTRLDPTWKDNDDFNSPMIKALQDLLINIYQFPEKYFKKR